MKKFLHGNLVSRLESHFGGTFLQVQLRIRNCYHIVHIPVFYRENSRHDFCDAGRIHPVIHSLSKQDVAAFQIEQAGPCLLRKGNSFP